MGGNPGRRLRAGLGAALIIALAGCGSGVGGGSGEAGFTIPKATITVNGDAADWASVPACIIDTNDAGDDVSAAGSDIESVKLAADPATDRLYVLIRVNGAVDTGLIYRLWFDNDRDGDLTDEPGDRQVDFQYSGGQWHVLTGDLKAPPTNTDRPDCGEVAVSGSYLEASFIPGLIGLSSVFRFSGQSLLGADPFTPYDGFAKAGYVNAPIPWVPTDYHRYKVYVANWPSTPYDVGETNQIGTIDAAAIAFFDLDTDGDVDADDEPSDWEDGVTGVINCHTPAHHPLDYGAIYVGEGTSSKVFTLPAGTYTDLIILVDGYPNTVRLDAIGWNGGVYFGSTAGTAVARGYGDAGDVIGIADGYCFTLGPEFGWFMCRMDSFSFSDQVTIYIDPALAPGLEVPTSEYPTIQSAIDAAPPGARILVAPGEYRESLNFHGKALTVESQEGPDCTAIVGAGDGLPAVAFTGGEGRDAVLRGFTVRGGAVGIEVRASRPTVAGNVIVSGLACAEPDTRSRLEWQNRIGDPQPAGLGGGPGPSGAAAQGSGASPAALLLWAGGLGLLAGLLLLAVFSRRRRSEEKSRA